MTQRVLLVSYGTVRFHMRLDVCEIVRAANLAGGDAMVWIWKERVPEHRRPVRSMRSMAIYIVRRGVQISKIPVRRRSAAPIKYARTRLQCYIMGHNSDILVTITKTITKMIASS